MSKETTITDEKFEQEEFETEDGVIEEPESEEEIEKAEEAIAAEFETECAEGTEYGDGQQETQASSELHDGLVGLSLYMHQIGQYENLSVEEETALGLAAKNGDEAAREKLVNHNLRLVVSIAKKFAGHGVDIEDLIAYGNLGLMEAIDRFDFNKGFKITTYATYWIRMEISRGIQKMKNMISKPDHVINAISAVNKVYNALQGVLTREPTSKEISMAMNGKFSDRQVEAIRALMMNSAAVSLDKQLDSQDSDSDTLGSLVADENHETPMEYAMRMDKDRILTEAVNKLKPQFQTVIRMRYGIGTEPGTETRIYTLDEIADQLLVEGFTNKLGGRYTKEYVRQLENNALAALKADPTVMSLGGAY